MIDQPYNIRKFDKGFDYYADVHDTIDALMNFTIAEDNECLDFYINFMSSFEKQCTRNRGEYLLDLLLTGILWRVYGELATRASKGVILALEILWRVRVRFPLLKKTADSVRAILINRYFVKNAGQNIPFTNDGMEKLCRWLKATGEFREEAMRINYWCDFYFGLSQKTKKSCFDYLIKITDFFVSISETRLSKYTCGVERFRADRFTAGEIREDVLLCTRPEILYHLNMVGSEIMNDGLRQGFDLTDKKVVLLPGCMRPEGGKECKAQKSSGDLLCLNCQSQCMIGQITGMGKIYGFTTAIVVHSSNFSNTIKRWTSEKSTGVVASACCLHLLMGGYEMNRAGINAQCIPLNFSGCARHWHNSGIPTELNIDRLIRLICSSRKSLKKKVYQYETKNVDIWNRTTNGNVCLSSSDCDNFRNS